MGKFDEKTKDFESAFNDAYDAWYPWMAEAHTDLKYVIDSPWTAEDIAYFRDQNREILNFNITRRIVKMTTGYERRNRLSLKIGPSEGSDDRVASQLTGVVMPLMENHGGYEEMSNAFEMGALITGANLIGPYLNRRGDIKFSRKPYNKFLLDPGFTKRDLTDCGYLIIHEEGMLTDDVKSLVPGAEGLITQYAKQHDAQVTMPFSAYKGRGREEGLRCNYQEFWEQTTKKVKVLANRQSGKSFVYKGTDEELAAITAQFYEQLVSYDEYRESVEFSAFVNGKCVYSKGDDPNKIDEYPYTLFAGFFYPEYDDQAKKLQGIVRPIRDPQREISKRMSKILDMIDTQVSSGMIAEENALVDPDDVHASGQGKGILVKSGKIGAVKPIEAPDIPQGLFQLNREIQEFVNSIAGVNDSLFGSDELKQQVSGYLMKLRQGSALTALQDLFDNLRFSKKNLGFKLIKMIQANYSKAKVARIINKQPVEQFYTEDLTRYDITPQEGILTETQRQMFYTELRQAKADGAPITWTMIFEHFPTTLPEELKKAIAQEEQRQQQMQAEDLKEKRLLDKMREAKIAADLGRGEERKAAVVEHHADSTLKRVKTMKELEKMDFDKKMALIDQMIKLETATQKQGMTKR